MNPASSAKRLVYRLLHAGIRALEIAPSVLGKKPQTTQHPSINLARKSAADLLVLVITPVACLVMKVENVGRVCLIVR